MGSSRLEPDLLLLHAPSVYDFREHAILYGPVSDMVPSSTVFEMYPLGFLTIASYLHERGLDKDVLVVACGDAALELLELQRSGGRRVPASVFLQSAAIEPGQVLASAA